MFSVDNLKFDEKGLIPAVVVDHYTKEVLTLAYMDRESLGITLEKGLTCFYSRSRKKLWLKGETSGNFQHVVSVTADCDGDALVVEVVKDGPACHTGEESCFHSYTTYLFEKGIDKILKKVGEESTEVIVAGKGGSREETVFEISDLIYHLTVLMVEMGISLEDVAKELEKRHVVDTKVKQETMR